MREANRHLSPQGRLVSDVILTLAPDRDGSLWIGTPDGLNHLQRRKDSSPTPLRMDSRTTSSAHSTQIAMDPCGSAHVVALPIGKTGIYRIVSERWPEK